jgi:hydrogenase/urease accessory protein HupE
MQKHLSRTICLMGLALLAILGTALPSQAHWADLAVGEIQIGAKQAAFSLTIPTGLVSIADDNHDNQLSATEVERHSRELKQVFQDKIQLINQQGDPGDYTLQAAPQSLAVPQANTQSHTTLQLDYTWPQPIEELTLRYRLFAPDAPAARLLVTASHNSKTQSLVLTSTADEFTLISRSIAKQIYSFALLGIEHILTGYDHILFLISLLLVSPSLKAVFKIVTAFTISHSVTLSLAVLNVVTLPSQFVECAIALTIVYVALENLWKRNFDHRWGLTFGFGLVHGLGFAGALREMQIPRSNLFTSLASFNLGVEIGQVAIVTGCFFLFKLIGHQVKERQWQGWMRRSASLGIACMGLVWFAERAFAWGRIIP